MKLRFVIDNKVYIMSLFVSFKMLLVESCIINLNKEVFWEKFFLFYL